MGCKCTFCRNYEKYKWAVVMECKCGCHSDGMTEHESLCCGFPNVLKKNNPFVKLRESGYYKKKMDKWSEENKI